VRFPKLSLLTLLAQCNFYVKQLSKFLLLQWPPMICCFIDVSHKIPLHLYFLLWKVETPRQRIEHVWHENPDELLHFLVFYTIDRSSSKHYFTCCCMNEKRKKSFVIQYRTYLITLLTIDHLKVHIGDDEWIYETLVSRYWNIGSHNWNNRTWQIGERRELSRVFLAIFQSIYPCHSLI